MVGGLVWSVTICLILIITNAGSKRPHHRLDVLEKRMNILEIQTSTAELDQNEEMQQVLDRLMSLNDSVVALERACLAGSEFVKLPQRQENGALRRKYEQPANREWASRITTAFKQEKSWTKNELRVLGKVCDNVNEEQSAIKTEVAQFSVELTILTEKVESNVKRFLVDQEEQNKQYMSKLGELNETIAIQTEQILNYETVQRENEQKMSRLSQDISTLRSEMISLRKTDCPMKWKRYDLFCYHFFSDIELNFDKAKRLCSDVGAHLVDLQDADESEFVKAMVGSSVYWLGMRDNVNEGEWIWERTGAVATYMYEY